MVKQDVAVIPIKIPKELWEKIQEDAAINQRSGSGQIRWILEQYYKDNVPT
ncbi:MULTISPECIES: hypothetical protein [Calothrix]|uniref:CopG-like ribbon-helix-helix domain-containing protein n=2 Tax=Calothrix TaxID=1186 RepID=A0ABR8A9C5_9CYAN|nr:MULTISPECIES: hypothetical protein [Calothrix]MBD2196596.1 hypothetical protein [Calothrix parietina FACHB-288]MBD2228039.1 hypothetical protein [Calothrix anomala FACHB-343]